MKINFHILVATVASGGRLTRIPRPRKGVLFLVLNFFALLYADRVASYLVHVQASDVIQCNQDKAYCDAWRVTLPPWKYFLTPCGMFFNDKATVWGLGLLTVSHTSQKFIIKLIHDLIDFLRKKSSVWKLSDTSKLGRSWNVFKNAPKELIRQDLNLRKSERVIMVYFLKTFLSPTEAGEGRSFVALLRHAECHHQEMLYKFIM